MKLARELERRLESLLDGIAGRVFRGPIHPSELAGRLVKQADLSLVTTDAGPVVANVFTIRVHPGDVATEASDLAMVERELAQLIEEAAEERGWRLDGPVRVRVVADERISTGSVRCESESRAGGREPWALLRGATAVPLMVNRSIVGRGSDADAIVAGDDTVSRRHALVWTEGGRYLVRDLGSANGTFVDGQPVGGSPTHIAAGSRLTLGSSEMRFEPLPRTGG